MKKGINKNSCFLILSLLLLTISCNTDLLFTDSVAMPGRTWSLSDIAEFTVPVTDTISASEVSFTIRTGSDFPFRNLYLFVTTVSPKGESLTDTLQYDLADEKGNWIGKGFGDVHELRLPYKSNVFFPENGLYNFKIQHGMRTVDLKGVYDFSLRIQRIKR